MTGQMAGRFSVCPMYILVFRGFALVDVLHLPVHLVDGVAAQAKAVALLRAPVTVGFIPQLVLQAGPHIHGDGAQLDLHRQLQRPLRDDNGHLHDQVQAAVAGFLGGLDIVRFADHAEGLGPGQQAAEIVDIVQVVADDPHARHVLDVGVDIVDGQVIAPAPEFFGGALQGFDAVLDVVDGRVVVQAGELLVQDLHLGHGDLQRAAVQVLYPYHSGGHLFDLRHHLLYLRGQLLNGDVPQLDAAALLDHHRRAPSFLIVKYYTMWQPGKQVKKICRFFLFCTIDKCYFFGIIIVVVFHSAIAYAVVSKRS